MTCSRSLLCSLLILLPLCATPVATAQERIPLDETMLEGLRVRQIGPAVMGGRIADLDALASDPRVLWVGTASGGVWKSDNGGTTFKPVFDEHPQSIGALAIDQQHPDTVWVGTGEPWVRNSVSVGRGVFRTADGGKTWQHLGLEDSERIADVILHPDSSDVAYVCALGPLWSDGAARGLYKTKDAGQSWKKILYVDERTGCADLAMDPQEPGILYAALWEFRRQPWSFSSGGEGSGLYQSLDGGKTWREITGRDNGLPQGELGRIAVAVAPSRPNRLYAVVESDDTALYRSDDRGRTWERKDNSMNVTVRPFYFARLVVDPHDYDRVYKPGLSLGVSVDGGASFDNRGAGVHSDHHALWVNPNDPQHLYLGTDGGLYISRDGGGTWTMADTLPVSQFYHVAYDLAEPYHVCGGLQDNGSWCGPSQSPNGIQNRDWENLGGGDGFYVLPDLHDPNITYWQYQGGHIRRYHEDTGETKDLQPQPAADDPEYRYNWDTPVYLSRAAPGVIFVGSQFLHRSEDRGESWQKISPDLTTNDPAKQQQAESGGLTIDNSTAENHTTIYAISDAPDEADVIWVGTDDGNLHVTRDGGATWTNVIANVPDLPANTWVSGVEASSHDPAAAYATFDGHRTGDMATYVYKTKDYGQTWTPLADSTLDGYAHVIRQDPVNPNLLFLGTDFGLYTSVDDGLSWARITGNMPPVGVFDLAIHPRAHDLILGTHGRGIMILDDITTLRQLTPAVLQADVHLFDNRPVRLSLPESLQEFPGAEFRGPNPPDVATITFFLKKRHIFGDLRVEILDEDGHRVSTLPGSRRAGLNRIEWAIRRKPPKVPAAKQLVGGAMTGPQVEEGTYTVRLVKGNAVYEGAVTAVPDPTLPHSAEDRRLQQQTTLRLYDLIEDLAYTAESITDLRDQAQERRDALGGKKPASDLEAFEAALTEIHKTLVATREGGWLTGEEQLREELASLYSSVLSYGGRPSDTQLRRTETLAARLEEKQQALDALLDAQLDRLNRDLARRDQPPLEKMTREAFEEAS